MKTGILTLVLLFVACSGSDEAAEKTATNSAATRTDSLTIVGEFRAPESIWHDESADLYYVSNINEDAIGHDDNGFISRIKPDGTIEALHFLDGANRAITLNGPKGLAIRGDTLFVADIDTVRAFSIANRTALAAYGIRGATFLNDLALGNDGTLYVTDSGLTTDFAPSGTDAIYRRSGNGFVAVVKGEWLGHPNGIVSGPEGITFVTYGSNRLIRLTQGGGKADTLATMPAGSLDGLVRLDSTNFIVTSWESNTVYHVDGVSGEAHPLFTNMESPADIGYDAKRRRILIPLFTRNQLEVRQVP